MPTTERRLTAADFHPEVLKLFDQYVHGAIDRRAFLDRSARFAAMGGTTAAALLAALNPKFAQAQKVAPGDPRLRTERVDIPAPAGHGHIRALVARPAQAAGPLPAVVVVHENRGLNPHIEDIARRLALENFIAVAPDGLTPHGGYPGDEDKAREAFAKLDQAKAREDWVAAAHFTRSIAGGNGKLGAIGFCYGGTIVNLLAVRVPQLVAGVPFYGDPPPLGEVANIKAELKIFHAGNDQRLLATWPAYDAALKAAHVRHSATIYPGTVHGFHNDTTPRYDETAARDAWGQALALFGRTLRSPSA
ncbi:MAG TPA: dienelactone hydrolase family protein [Burkholderiaceae bacterium]|nr:dienelactone hydrolase family protein [Burkholderiaceae bacterium]